MINLKEFKQAVLQKAMQGKLTKQLPSDSNAKDLLVKIANRKRDLVQAGKLKGYSKPLPPVTSKEIPFKIPDNWEWIRFSSLYDMVGGSQPPKSHFITHKENNYIRLYQTRDYGSNPKPVYIPKDEARKTTKKNDILVARYGGSLGKIFRADNGAYNVALAKVTPIINTSELNIDYVWDYLKSSFYSSFVDSLSKSAQAGFNKHDLLKLIIPVPPLAEQQRIVSKVHKCFLLADTIQKERDLHQKFAHDIKQSLLLEAMKGHLTQQLPSDGNADDLLQSIQQKKQQLIQVGKIRKHKKLPPISKDEIPFKIPKNWNFEYLGNISIIISGYAFKKSMYKKAGVRVIRITDFNKYGWINKKPKFVKYNKKFSKFLIHNGDTLISMTGQGSVGKTSPMVNTKEILLLNQRIARIHAIKFSNKFLHYYLISSYIYYKIHENKNSTNANISMRFLNHIIVPLPPLPEQHRIVSKLHDLFNTINA